MSRRRPPGADSTAAARYVRPMCRSIKTLRSGERPATDDDIGAAALQYGDTGARSGRAATVAVCGPR